jgi:hypothetical protein
MAINAYTAIVTTTASAGAIQCRVGPQRWVSTWRSIANNSIKTPPRSSDLHRHAGEGDHEQGQQANRCPMGRRFPALSAFGIEVE